MKTAQFTDKIGPLLAVIPARGASKRLPGKNIRPLMGKPILSYTVQAAIESGLFERVIVSTDSEQIAQVACECGAEAPFLRQADLADDHTPVSLVTLDAICRLDPTGKYFAAVAQLMPNCPLRTAEDVRDSCDQFLTSGSASQISVTRYGWQNPWWAMQRDGEYVLEPLFESYVTQRSQDLPELFCPTGAVWWARTGVLRSHKTYHIPGRTGWDIPWDRAVDIDTDDDWKMAELLMAMREARAEGANAW